MSKSQTPALEDGKDQFTLLQLFERVAAYKGVESREYSYSRMISQPVATYMLDDRSLAFLAEQGIKRQERPERPDCRDEIFTLVDHNPQEATPGFVPSNYWNFKALVPDGGFRLRITLSIVFVVDHKRRGFVLYPSAPGTFVSPANHLPNVRMFKALVEYGKTEDGADVPAVARELAASEGDLVVSWTDLGLGGIRRLAELFMEFAHGNQTVEDVARRLDVFDPRPINGMSVPEPNLEEYVAEPAQSRLFDAWREQLESFRAKLVV